MTLLKAQAVCFISTLVQVLSAAFWEEGLIEHIICTFQSDTSHQVGIQFQRAIEGEKSHSLKLEHTEK